MDDAISGACEMTDDPTARAEGFYWVVLGQNAPEISYWERGEWEVKWHPWACRPRPDHSLSITVVFTVTGSLTGFR